MLRAHTVSTSQSNYPLCYPPVPIAHGIKLTLGQHSSHVLSFRQTERTKAQNLGTFLCQTPSLQVPWALYTHMVPSETQLKPSHLHTFTLPSGPHLFQRQQHELLCLGHLHEVLEDILVRRLEEVAAGVRVSKTPDPQAVGWVQLAEQELAASVPHTIELKQAGSREKCLAVEKNWGGKESFQGKETIFTLVSLQVNHRAHRAPPGTQAHSLFPIGLS